MGYMCIRNHELECDGCMACKETTTYTCPVCGHTADECVYVFKNGDVIGCENCVKEKSPEDMIIDEVEW